VALFQPASPELVTRDSATNGKVMAEQMPGDWMATSRVKAWRLLT
jgi:hypothetical protein